MNCQTCQGNGELEHTRGSAESYRPEDKEKDSVRIFWPYTCPACGGSGYLEE